MSSANASLPFDSVNSLSSGSSNNVPSLNEVPPDGATSPKTMIVDNSLFDEKARQLSALGTPLQHSPSPSVYSGTASIPEGVQMRRILRAGLDVGSTTVKMVVMNENNQILFKEYRKHFSDIKASVVAMLNQAKATLDNSLVSLVITGSGGITISNVLNSQFVQEVIACTTAVERIAPQTDVAIELGGEDAKITYFGKNLEQRMNGTCAGGTGSFIDQMSILLETDAMGLNALAAKHTIIYPIASRCGVFAKTDVQPLLNEGAKKEDIAASILQSVVNQTVGGLACGKAIRGHVAFLGGPLHFLDQLRQRFIETLDLKDDEIIVPEDAHFFVATGAAFCASPSSLMGADVLYERIHLISDMVPEEKRLPPLFMNDLEYLDFKKRHEKAKAKRSDINEQNGKCFLGIDSGSTTTKVVLINNDGDLLFDYYGTNQGNPLQSVKNALLKLYDVLPKQCQIVRSAVTGYGEGLIKAALRIDHGEIETVAHYKAAEFFSPGVEFVLDIGGQDMKSLHIHHGVIDSIMLNEACSSGCGSFISTFATGLQMKVEDFAREGIKCQHPVDLGTRCTVFMNSRVKQAQKEGAEVADISGGIALSVIKNALFKVIRMRNTDEMGTKIVVQGGTFLNDAVLRAFETIVGKDVVRPDIAGLMGAFGVALIAKEQYDKKETQTATLTKEQINQLVTKQETKRCGRCTNNCLLTITRFPWGSAYVSGNRCERGSIAAKKQAKEASEKEEKNETNEKDRKEKSDVFKALVVDDVETEQKNIKELPNMFSWKNQRVFKYPPLKPSEATRGTIGIPRALNMFDDYPFWAAFFNELKIRIVLSPPSTKNIYELGMETIPSDTICYPAKLVHGHVLKLKEQKVTTIFYPGIPYIRSEDTMSSNNFNCPVVTSYCEVIRGNLPLNDITFIQPFLPMDNPERMKQRTYEELVKFYPDLTVEEINRAIDKGYQQKDDFDLEVHKKGEEILEYLEKNNKQGIVLMGRPYHVDPEINHGIADVICSFGFPVLTEDGVAHLGRKLIRQRMRIENQWVYHARMYAAAEFITSHKRLNGLQLVSFGCGLDAVTTDQIKEIFERKGRVYTAIKIDEINNLGAARIRVRSLIAVIKRRLDEEGQMIVNESDMKILSFPTPIFSKANRQTHTILVPQFSQLHMPLLVSVFIKDGLNAVILDKLDQASIDAGLKFVHNDACFPALCVVGQLMNAVNSGKYDLSHTTIALFQTGGCCRATNYIAFMKKALQDNGTAHIPVLSLNFYGMEQHPGFQLGPGVLMRAGMGIIYGDIFTTCLPRVRPYELVPGSANELHKRMLDKAIHQLTTSGSRRTFLKTVKEILHEFETFPIDETMKKPRVGIIGEILVKVHDDSNNHLVEFLEKEGAEATWHGLVDFLIYCAFDNVTKYRQLSGSKLVAKVSGMFMDVFEFLRQDVVKLLKKSTRFHPPDSVIELAARTEKFVSLCNQSGEGWYLVAEILSLIHSGIDNILILQPFACLPNHITGRGMVRLMRDSFPTVNIAAIDYDPGASEVNQINRVKLMLAVAKKNLYGNQHDASTFSRSPFASPALLVPNSCPRTSTPVSSSQLSMSSSISPTSSPPTLSPAFVTPVRAVPVQRKKFKPLPTSFSAQLPDMEDLASSYSGNSAKSTKTELDGIGCLSLCSSCHRDCEQRAEPAESCELDHLHNPEGLDRNIDPNGLALEAEHQKQRLSRWYIQLLFVIVAELVWFFYYAKLFCRGHPGIKKAVVIFIALLLGLKFYYPTIR